MYTRFYKSSGGGRHSPRHPNVRYGPAVRLFGASTAPPSRVERMVSTVPARAEGPILTMCSPLGIHPAYQHGSDADMGNQMLDPDNVGDLGDVRPPVGALQANQAHSGDMGATSPGAEQRGLWNWQSSGAVRAPEPVLNSKECSSIQDTCVGLQQLRARELDCLKLNPSCKAWACILCKG